MRLGQDRLIQEELWTQAHQIPLLEVKNNDISKINRRTVIERPSFSHNQQVELSRPSLDLLDIRKTSFDAFNKHHPFNTPSNLGYGYGSGQLIPENRPLFFEQKNMRVTKLSIEVPETFDKPNIIHRQEFPKNSESPTIGDRSPPYYNLERNELGKQSGSYSFLPEVDNNPGSGKISNFRNSIRHDSPQHENSNPQVQEHQKNHLNIYYGIEGGHQHQQPGPPSKNLLSRDVSLDIARTQNRPTIREVPRPLVLSYQYPAQTFIPASPFVSNMVRSDPPAPQVHNLSYGNRTVVEDPYRNRSSIVQPIVLASRPSNPDNHQPHGFSINQEDKRKLTEHIEPFKLLPFRNKTDQYEQPQQPKSYQPFQNMISDIYSNDQREKTLGTSNYLERLRRAPQLMDPNPKIQHSRSLYDTFQPNSPRRTTVVEPHDNKQSKPSKHYSPISLTFGSVRQNDQGRNLMGLNQIGQANHFQQEPNPQPPQNSSFINSRPNGHQTSPKFTTAPRSMLTRHSVGIL